MAKSNKDRTRRETVEQLRREAQQAERRRTLIVVAVCAAIALAIIALPAYKLIRDNQEQSKLEGTELAALGVPASQASCSPATTKPATGSNQHQPEGTKIIYDQAPPAYGAHYTNPAPITRKFYTPQDRPAVEQLVHNLEHGYSILWYDDALADDSDAQTTLKAIASKFDSEDYNASKFIVAPWTAEDSGVFPEGKHVALTHWSATWEDGAIADQQGVTQYCAEPSGEVVADFVETNPADESPEPNSA